MSAINIHGVPNASGGYSLTGKKVMVHDPVAPLATSTVMVDATDLGTGGGVYSAPMWKQTDGDMTIGETDFTHASLIGATQMNFIIVNKVIEFINEDYTFDPLTGTIDRTPNQWFAGDKMITPHKTA
jgi:hypothetical protein